MRDLNPKPADTRHETIRGALEIDRARGVIYFHASHPSVHARYEAVTILRIQGLTLEQMALNKPIDLNVS